MSSKPELNNEIEEQLENAKNLREEAASLLAKYEHVPYDDLAAHRADYDAEVLCQIFERLIHKLSVQHSTRPIKVPNAKTLELKNFFFRSGNCTLSKGKSPYFHSVFTSHSASH